MTDHYLTSDGETLKNKLGVTSQEELKRKEDFIVLQRADEATEIAFNADPITFGTFQDIHEKLFGDLYEWAGKPRTVHLAKGDMEFCRPQFIQAEAEKAFKELQDNDYFKDQDLDTYVVSISKPFGDLNLTHPFREGNGRSQKILFEAIVAKAGYEMQWDLINKDEHIEAVVSEAFGNSKLLEDVFKKGLKKKTSA